MYENTKLYEIPFIVPFSLKSEHVGDFAFVISVVGITSSPLKVNTLYAI